MFCQNCHKNRILSVNGKCSDMCDVQSSDIGGMSYDGYVPRDLNIGGGDYIEFEMCLDCGQVQGKFPISAETVAKALGK